MSESNAINCQKAKDELDNLIEAMVDARLHPQSADRANFEPAGELKTHIETCSDCHNYHLANRIIIEASKALPRLEGDEDLTSSILALVEKAQSEEVSASSAASRPMISPGSLGLLIVSFLAFTMINVGSLTTGISAEELWSTASWALALLAVALLKPMVEGGWSLNQSNRSIAKA